MALTDTFANRLPAPGGLATMPAPVRTVPPVSPKDAILRDRALWLSRMNGHLSAVTVTQVVTAREAEHIRQTLSRKPLPIALEPEVLAALNEWHELWGEAPERSQLEIYLMMRDAHAFITLAGVQRKHAYKHWLLPPPKVTFKPDPEPVMDKANTDLDAEMRELHGAPPLPQDLQSPGETFVCGRNAASIIAATAQKLAATPENIQAAAKAKFDDDGPGPDSAPEAEAWLDRLLEDVRDGLSDFDRRKNKHNTVLIRTRIWLRKGTYDVYLEREGLPHGVIVCTQAPTGTWVPTVFRDEIRAWLKLKPGPSAKDVPAATSRASLVGAPATGAALDEIGEYARNAPREDAA